MAESHGVAAQHAKAPLTPFRFERREPGKSDIEIAIDFCAICHTDIHQVRDEWGGAIFPSQARRRTGDGRTSGQAVAGAGVWAGSEARHIAGSIIGGIAETQEMLDYCAKHGVVSDIEIIPIQRVDEAYKRMLKNDVKYRFVIDLATLGKPEQG